MEIFLSEIVLIELCHFCFFIVTMSTRSSKRKASDIASCNSTEIPTAPATPHRNENEIPIPRTGTSLSRQGSVISGELYSNRREVMSKECYFMAVAKLAAQRSKDPSMQVGACLVDSDQKFIIGVGYNGTPNNIPDSEYPWHETDPDQKKCKNDYVIHAEANALSLSDRTRHKDSIMYCTHYPCVECAKAMVHAGVKKIIFDDDQKLHSKVKTRSYMTSENLLRYVQEKGIMTHAKFSSLTGKTVNVTVSCQSIADDISDIDD